MLSSQNLPVPLLRAVLQFLSLAVSVMDILVMSQDEAAARRKKRARAAYHAASGSPRERRFNEHGSKARVIVECAFGKLKGQYRCLHNGLKTRSPGMWNEIVLCCCCLHNLSIFVSGAGWSYEAGVVRGSKDPSDANTFGMDPDEMHAGDYHDRVPDDPAAFAKRDALLALLQANNFEL